jgi:soluble lytic murein transglycosylase-like protein
VSWENQKGTSTMMPSGAITSLKAMSGSGIDAVESRVKQLESMIQSFEAAQQATAPTKATKPFQAYLQKSNLGQLNLSAPPQEVSLPGAEGIVSSLSASAAQSSASGGIRFSANGITGSMQARYQAFQPMIEKYSQQFGVDKDLVNALIKQESGFNPGVVSKAGAKGLMQLMPSTARALGVTDSGNPEKNLEGGIKLLKNLLSQYNGNIPLALAAYNAGSGAVDKYKGIPPYKETQNYVKSILSSYLAQKQNSNLT